MTELKATKGIAERLRGTTQELACVAYGSLTVWDRHSNACLDAADTIDALSEVLIGSAASLAAAISLLEHGGKAAKKAAPSDRMFDMMLRDYRGALADARAALRRANPEGK